MRNLKKVLSVLVVFAFMLGFIATSASAIFPDQEDIVNTEAVNMCVALNIIQGRETGNFDPEDVVTRAEMAKMICIILNGGNDPVLGTSGIGFVDTVGHWAEKYIDFCAAEEIVAGMGDGTFNPNAGVTGTQAAKMLLVALGFDAEFEGFNGVKWAVNINAQASAKKLYEELASLDPNAPLSRDDAAQMMWNALEATMVEYKYSLTTEDGVLKNIQERVNKLVTLLGEEYKTAEIVGTLVNTEWVSKDKVFRYTVYTGTTKDSDDNDVYNTVKYTSANDYTGLFGMNVKMIVKSGKTSMYGMFAEDSKVLASGTFNDLDTVDTTHIEFDGVKYALDYTVTDIVGAADGIKANDALYSLPIVAENAGIAAGVPFEKAGAPAKFTSTTPFYYEARLIDNDDNGKVDWVVYLPFVYAQVDSVNTKNVTMADIGVNLIAAYTSIKFEDANIYEDIAEDDVVMILAAANNPYDEVTVAKMDTVNGKVTGVQPTKIGIDGTMHPIAGDADLVPSDVKIGSTYTFAVVGSFLFYVDSSSNASADKILYVSNATNVLDIEARVHFADGTSAKVIVDSYTDKTGEVDTVAEIAGHLYSFTVSGGEYKLTRITNDDTSTANTNEANLQGYDSIKVGAADAGATPDDAGMITKAETNKVGKLVMGNGTNTSPTSYVIGDDAVVFVQYADGTKVLTGATAKKLAEGKNAAGNVITSGAAIVAPAKAEVILTGSTAKVVALVAPALDKIPSAQGSKDNYGYILTAYTETEDANGDTIYTFNMWTANGLVEGAFADANTNIAKGNIVNYTALADKEVDDVVLAGGTVGAITKIDADTIYFQTGAGFPTTGGTVVERYKTSDTVVIYIDTHEVEGYETGAIKAASKADATSYRPNAYILANGDNEIELIVVDVAGDWKLPT